MSEALKACPYAVPVSGPHVLRSTTRREFATNDPPWSVLCSCGSTGPLADSIKKAEDAWNDRRPSEPPGPEGAREWIAQHPHVGGLTDEDLKAAHLAGQRASGGGWEAAIDVVLQKEWAEGNLKITPLRIRRQIVAALPETPND